MKKNLSESILTELDRSNIMSDSDVIDICNAYSSRMNLNYKLEGNSAVYEDGTIIKFIVNDDDDIEYYCINKQGDKSTTALVKDWKLLDLLTEEDLVESGTLKINISMDLFDSLLNSLSSMINYADDGMLDRNDPEYNDFFNAVDTANDVLSQANKFRDEYFENNSIHTMLDDED